VNGTVRCCAAVATRILSVYVLLCALCAAQLIAVTHIRGYRYTGRELSADAIWGRAPAFERVAVSLSGPVSCQCRSGEVGAWSSEAWRRGSRVYTKCLRTVPFQLTRAKPTVCSSRQLHRSDKSEAATGSVARAVWSGSGVIADGKTECSGVAVADSLVWIAACG